MRAIIALVVGAIALMSSGLAQADVKFGVMANRGELAATNEWTEFSKYLSEKVGQPVQLVTFPIDRTFDLVASKGVDFVLTNPAQTAGLEEKYGVAPLASWKKQGETAFGGVIIANAKSGVTKIADIKGKKVIAFNTESAGAYIFQRYQLLQSGVDVTKDVAAIQYTKKQDDIVLAVKAGVMDVGFVRTGVLESMVAGGRLAMSDVVVVNPMKEAGFDQALSTPLYPDWFISAAAGVDAGVIAKVKAAVLAVKPDLAAAKEAKIDGFVEPLPRDKLTAMLKALKLAPFDK